MLNCNKWCCQKKTKKNPDVPQPATIMKRAEDVFAHCHETGNATNPVYQWMMFQFCAHKNRGGLILTLHTASQNSTPQSLTRFMRRLPSVPTWMNYGVGESVRIGPWWRSAALCFSQNASGPSPSSISRVSRPLSTCDQKERVESDGLHFLCRTCAPTLSLSCT